MQYYWVLFLDQIVVGERVLLEDGTLNTSSASQVFPNVMEKKRKAHCDTRLSSVD